MADGITADDFRRALGGWASGVTVITSGRAPDFHGMTASSFASLSLNPPLILVCVDNRAHMRALLDTVGAFTVNILAADQGEVSRYFANRNRPAPPEEMAAIPYTVGATGTPQITGAAAALDCTVEQVADGGDHRIYMGRIIAADVREEAEPLLFYRGQYGQFRGQHRGGGG